MTHIDAPRRLPPYGPIDMCGLMTAVLDTALVVMAWRGSLAAEWLRWAILGSAGMLVIVFLAMTLDPITGRAIIAANMKMQNGVAFTRRGMMLFDPTWGFFGSMQGGIGLKAVKSVAAIEFLAALVTNGSEGARPPLLLAGAAFALTILVTLRRLKFCFPPPAR